MATTAQINAITALYAGYFNRAPDPLGLQFWIDQIDGGRAFNTIAADFAASPEAKALYPYLTTPDVSTPSAFIQSVYMNLFGRAAETAGLNFWVGVLNSGAVSVADMIEAIINGAVDAPGAVPPTFDASTMSNKIEAGLYFAETASNTPGFDYDNPASKAAALAALAGVTSDDATVTASQAATDVFLGNGGPGETFVLTDGIDNINVTGVNTVDMVKGLIDPAGTFTVGDEIAGNGKTVVQLAVATTPANAPYAVMSGVDALNIIAADTGTMSMDASTYGTDISKIALSGKDGFVLDVNDLEVEGSLTASVAAGSDSDVQVSGVMDGVDFNVILQNDDIDGVGAMATVGLAGIDVMLGQDDVATVTLSQTSSKSAAAVSVGDLSVGDVALNLGESASADATIWNYAHNTGKGSATAGSVTVGNIDVVAGLGADVSFSVYNSATANSGAATIGNITVGDVTWSGAGSAEGDFYFSNEAEATKGNATAGDITIGNVNITTGSSSDSVSLSASNYANASTSGNATVGNITVGDLTFVAGDNFDSPDFDFDNNAYADKGNATAGNIVVGDISMTGGDNGGEIEVTVNNYANVATSGAATVGDVTVGNVDFNVGSSATFNLDVSNEARTLKGAATVGAVTIGNITGAVGLSGTADINISITASGTAGDSVGNVLIGNIDLYGEPSADLTFDLNVIAKNGSVSDVTVGNVDMTVDNDGNVELDMNVTAQTNVGNVTVGDVSFVLGSGAYIDTFSIDVSAATGDIASFSIGDVTIVGAANAYDSSQGITVKAGDDIGDISIGDVSVSGGKSADFTSMTWDFTAVTGNIGNIGMGSTTLNAGENGDVWAYLNFTADDEIAGVTAGDITLTAAKSGSAWLSHNYVASDDIGDIAYGNISASANGANADAGYSFEADANSNTIGTVSFGNVDLTAAGDNAWAGASIWLSDTGDIVGLATVGDITLTASNTKAGAAAASVDFYMNSNGSITVGDIAANAVAATAAYADTALVDLGVSITTGNNLTVGNITVTGGSSNATPTVMDNMSDLNTWLNLTETGTGSITIGNVDYSGYAAAATIDVSMYKGAGAIMAAQTDTIITDNAGKNVITLGAGTDIINFDALTSTTDKSSATAIDEVINFTSGIDLINIDTSGGNAFSFVSSAAASYAAFLTAAGNAMTNFNTDIYARQVGADMYVAIDSDNGSAVDFVVKLTGVSSVTAADFAIV